MNSVLSVGISTDFRRDSVKQDTSKTQRRVCSFVL